MVEVRHKKRRYQLQPSHHHFSANYWRPVHFFHKHSPEPIPMPYIMKIPKQGKQFSPQAPELSCCHQIRRVCTVEISSRMSVPTVLQATDAPFLPSHTRSGRDMYTNALSNMETLFGCGVVDVFFYIRLRI